MKRAALGAGVALVIGVVLAWAWQAAEAHPDQDGDNFVSVADISAVVAAFGQAVPPPSPLAVTEQNLDANGNIKVREQGVVDVNVLSSAAKSVREARHCRARSNFVATCQPPPGETWWVTAVGVDAGGASETRLYFTDGTNDSLYLNNTGGLLSYQGGEFPITDGFYLKATGSTPTTLVVSAYVEVGQ